MTDESRKPTDLKASIAALSQRLRRDSPSPFEGCRAEVDGDTVLFIDRNGFVRGSMARRAWEAILARPKL